MGRNIYLYRESKTCVSVLFYGSISIGLDVLKQVVVYSLKYYNHNEYPLPQTQLVAINELLKFVVFLFIVVRNGKIWNIRCSLWYAVPSIIYAINNNIFYFALNYVTPPVWSILIQVRIIFTALTYRCFFYKRLLCIQWLALCVLIIAIVMTNLLSVDDSGVGEGNLWMASGLAIVGSATSVVGTITMEYLFKNDAGSFSEKQVQLYFFSCLSAWILYIPDFFAPPAIDINPRHPIVIPEEENNFIWILVLLSLFLTCSSGVAVAIIVKKLDNIVKLYTQALANVLLSILCAFLFPENFILSWHFVMALLLMCASIFVYENRGLTRRVEEPYLPIRIKNVNRCLCPIQ